MQSRPRQYNRFEALITSSAFADPGRPRAPRQERRGDDRHPAELPAEPARGRREPEAAGCAHHRRPLLRQGRQEGALRDLQERE